MISAEKNVSFKGFSVGNPLPFTLIAGPCLLESRDLALSVAGELHALCHELGIPFIFKGSFDKANRTRSDSPRGGSFGDAAPIFKEIKERYGCPVLTDVHTPDQCTEVASVVDVLQIPAFLCRQTDLLVAAARTGKAINVKKGQFLAPWDMKNVVEKIEQAGNHRILLCERGVSFGYNTLISDFRSLPVLAQTGYPVIFDATHSVQQPGGLGSASGGERHFVETLARAALSVGVAGLFIETHPTPETAPSDGPNMVPLKYMEGFLRSLKALDVLSKETPYQPFSLQHNPSSTAS